MPRLTLETLHHTGTPLVPIIKYTVFAGVSLLALLMVAGRVMTPAGSPFDAANASNSLEVLRKMANHGEVRGFAPLAAAGPFLPMPAVTPSMLAAVAEPVVGTAPVVATIAPPSVLNAQARVAVSDLIAKPAQAEKPSRAEKKVASRKPKPRAVYVENTQRPPSGGFLSAFNSW